MGSFSYTCAISGLPIEAGDKVRYLLLSSSPYTDEGCNMSGSWFPRTFPIKAEYNDYGSVENIEEGVGRDLWMEGLRLDLVSYGTGENTCHDVPTSKSMSFEHMLDALREGRVRVQRNYDRFGNSKELLKKFRPKTPTGVPTMQRVKKSLTKKGFKLCPGFTQEGYVIDKLRYGTIRIRWSGYGKDANGKEMYGRDEEFLSLIQPLLNKKYVTALKAGDGLDKADLLVFPRPGTKDFHGSRKDKKAPLHVNHMMIREDVWQLLLQTPVEIHYGKATASIEDHKQAMFDLYEKTHRTKLALDMAKDGSPEKQVLMFSLRHEIYDNYENLVAPYLKSEVPFTVGLGEHWKLLVDKSLPLVDVKHVLEAMAEFIHVWKVLQLIRIRWMPSTSCGPQCGEWEKHQDFLQRLVTITDAKVLERFVKRG